MYGYVIVASWLILIAIWVIGSFAAKPDIGSGSRVVRWLWQLSLLALLIFALAQNPQGDVFFLERSFFISGPALDWIGALLTVIGVAFAIWARYKLGRDWGSNTKEYPTLVTTGPYAYVRHPINAGAILALFGSALTGSIVAVAMFAGSIIFCLLRIRREERAMSSIFPGKYPTYQTHTKRVIPFVW
jgi:protein-S-isoprenylcysteine O-methyltransferase Ste14